MNWLETPATVLGLGVLLVSLACLLLVVAGIGLALASVFMKTGRAKRARLALRELRLMLTALRGAARRAR